MQVFNRVSIASLATFFKINSDPFYSTKQGRIQHNLTPVQPKLFRQKPLKCKKIVQYLIFLIHEFNVLLNVVC